MKKTRLFTIVILAIMSIVMLGSCGKDKTPDRPNTVSINNSAPIALKKAYTIYEKDNEFFGGPTENAARYSHMLILTNVNLDSLLLVALKNPLGMSNIMLPSPSVLVSVYADCTNPDALDFADYTFEDVSNLPPCFYGDYTIINNPVSLEEFLDGFGDTIDIYDIISGTFSVKDSKGTPEVELKALGDFDTSVELYFKGQFSDGSVLFKLIEGIFQ